MKKIPLLPRYFRWIGLILFLISFTLYLNGIYNFLPFDSYQFYIETYTLINQSAIKGEEDLNFGLHKINFSLILIIVPSMIGLGMIAFAKSKIIEDEFVSKMRLYSWSVSIVVFLVYCFIINVFIYGTLYLSFAIVAPHLLLLSFIFVFRMNLYQVNRRSANEE